jgi:uncharacterized protein YecE (DUF72 family)
MKQPSGQVWIGTSGWNYPHWRKLFYPPGLPQKQELAYIGSRFGTVEVNGTFYSLTRPSACEAWRQAVPPDFLFAIKGSRYITHMLKLRNFQAPLGNFFAQGILRLGRQLGPILWQLPPGLRFDADRAAAFFDALPRDIAAAERRARAHDARTTGRSALTSPDGRHQPIRHAVEPRHPSWMEDAALAQLEAHDVALVAADTAGKHPFSLARTAGFAYVRLHGSTQLYASQYTDEELAMWADRVRRLREDGVDVHVYFDNDARAYAPTDALRLEQAVGISAGSRSRPPALDLARDPARNPAGRRRSARAARSAGDRPSGPAR